MMNPTNILEYEQYTVNLDASLNDKGIKKSLETQKQCLNCASCKLAITDRYFLKAADKDWHVACLKCWICQTELQTEQSCFTRDGIVYCKEDYKRLFAKKSCIRCGLKITNDELVMRVRNLVFHVPCFCCVQCGRLLNTGEYFGLKGLLPFCQDDLLKNPLSISSPPSASANINMAAINPDESPNQNPASFQGSSNPGSQSNPQPNGAPNFTNNPGQIPPNNNQAPTNAVSLPSPHPFLFHPLSRLNNFYQPPHDAHNFHSIIPKVRGKKKRKENIYETGDEFCLGNPTRQKRMRTSFKHHQLRAMKSYFSLNHNPDAKDLKSLSEKTGLSKRVLQVWFQNARAKYRRNVSRTDGGNSQESIKDAKSVTEGSEAGQTFSKDGDGNDSSGNNENEEIMYMEDDDDLEEDCGDNDDCDDDAGTSCAPDESVDLQNQDTGSNSNEKSIMSSYMSHFSPPSPSSSHRESSVHFNASLAFSHQHHPHFHHIPYSDTNNNIHPTKTTDFHSLVHELDPNNNSNINSNSTNNPTAPPLHNLSSVIFASL